MVQRNMHWSDGLQQFLECKEQLRMHVERLPGPARTYLDVLSKYKSVYGVTGTLGPHFGSLNSSPEQDLIQKLNLDVKFLRGVPTFMPRKFEEEPPRFAQSAGEQLGHIALRLMREPTRPYLIVTETVKDANQIATQLRQCLEELSSLAQQALLKGEMGKLLGELQAASLWQVSPGTSACSGLGVEDLAQAVGTTPGASPEQNPRRILLYTRNDLAGSDTYDPDSGMKLGSGDIVVATALAGRGTDVLLEESAERQGGLHVILTYLPTSGRVERQVFGRSARQGQAGSGQMIAVLSTCLRVATYSPHVNDDVQNASKQAYNKQKQELQLSATVIQQGGWAAAAEFLDQLRWARDDRSKEQLEWMEHEELPFLRALPEVYERFVTLKWALKKKFYPRPSAKPVSSGWTISSWWSGGPMPQEDLLFFYNHDMVQINAQLLELWGYFLKYYARDESCAGRCSAAGTASEGRAEQLRNAFDKFFPSGREAAPGGFLQEGDFVVHSTPPQWDQLQETRTLRLKYAPVDVNNPAKQSGLDRGYDFFQNPSYLVQRAKTYIHLLLSKFRKPNKNGQDACAAPAPGAVCAAPSTDAGGTAQSKKFVEEFESRWLPDLEKAVELDPKYTFPAEYMLAVGHCSSTNQNVDIEQMNDKVLTGCILFPCGYYLDGTRSAASRNT